MKRCNVQKVAAFTGSVSIASMSSVGFGWGHLGHQMIAEVAADVAVSGKEFWHANRDLLGTFANVPDVVWKRGASAVHEKPTHWFQVDAYAVSPFKIPAIFLDYLKSVNQYTEPVIIKNGTAPWRSEEFYTLAVQAFKAGDYARGLQMTGALAHYVGDLSQPLHVSQNYDGQMSNAVGIHKFFESTNLHTSRPQPFWDAITAKAQSNAAQPELIAGFKTSLLNGIYLEVQRSAAQINTVLENDKTLGRDGEGAKAQLALASERLADGAATLSVVLSNIWDDAGQKDVAQVITATDPEWVAPEYQGTSVNTAALEDCF